MTATPTAAAIIAGAGASETPPLQLVGLIVTGMLQLGITLGLAAVNYAPPAANKVTPTLVLNGYDLVPSDTLTVTSFYGRLSYFPSGLSVTQGSQRFDVVDPATSAQVGTFDALVTQGLGYGYQELLVTANDGTNVGTGAGQTPPVGSLISTLKFARNLGWSYSAMPAPGGDVVSFKLLTPLGDIAIPMSFNAAKGIADHTVDNRPMDLTNGYFIAPADPNAEILTGTTGILPLFGTVQGHQLFSIYDSEGKAVGSFDGVFTTTSDIAGIYIQAVMVTGNDGINVGVDPGQVPPVGSVYNVIYDHDDENFFIYSALPWPTGNVVSLIQHTPDKVANVTPTFIDAASPPPAKPLKAPGGYLFVPVSESVPSGVNGLPPREVVVQGYQQFDVYDKTGAKVGTVNADVANQWDMFGIYSQAILVTDVIEGTAGTGAGEVPPAGSVYSFVYPGKGRFGTSHSTVPAGDYDLTGYQVITPWGNVPLLTIRRPADRAVVDFYNPL